jgi:D-sedoheptulose 7-phosphate isomerase
VTDRETLLRQRVADSIATAQRLLDGSDAIAATGDAAGRIADCLRAGGKVVFFGNGGSASDAGHLAAELLGRFALERRSLAAACLSDHTAAMTAISNDYGYDQVFARQIAGLGRQGDVAVGLSTSGSSPNVVRGLETARELGMTTVALTGASGGKVAAVVDVCIRVPSEETPRVQELCMLLGHTLCELVERELAGSPGSG